MNPLGLVGPALRLATLPVDVALGRDDAEDYVSRTSPSGPPPGCDDRWDFERGTWKRGCQ